MARTPKSISPAAAVEAKAFSSEDPGIALRLNALDLSRATEGAAIVMSIAVGRGRGPKNNRQQPDEPGVATDPTGRAMYVETARTWASTAMLGYLSQAFCRIQILHRDSTGEQHVWESWRDEATPHLQIPDGVGPFQIEAVVSAADGVHGLLEGRDSGAISALAIGRRGTFLPDLPQRSSVGAEIQYLVVALHPACGAGGADNLSYEERVKKTLLELIPGESMSGEFQMGDFFTQTPILTSLAKITRRAGGEPTVGCLDDQDNKLIRPRLNGHFRMRTFTGSSIAAAITAMTSESGVHAFVGVARATHTVLIAAAARALGAPMIAIPARFESNDSITISKSQGPDAVKLADKTVSKKPRHGIVVMPSGAVGADSIVLHDNVIFITTGITENVVVQGVRYHQGDNCTTHSLVLSGYSGTLRSIITKHDLRKSKIRWSEGGLRVAGDLIRELKRERNWIL